MGNTCASSRLASAWRIPLQIGSTGIGYGNEQPKCAEVQQGRLMCSTVVQAVMPRPNALHMHGMCVLFPLQGGWQSFGDLFEGDHSLIQELRNWVCWISSWCYSCSVIADIRMHVYVHVRLDCCLCYNAFVPCLLVSNNSCACMHATFTYVPLVCTYVPVHA